MVKRFKLAVASVIVGTFASMLIAELALRAIGITSTMVYFPSPYFGWSHTKNDRFSRTTDGRIIDIQINALGLRDRSIQYGRSPGTYRVLVLGDSFTEAFQVPLEATYVKRVEKKLTSLKGRNFELINAGVSGYGTDNELLFFRHEGYKYAPDMVILAFYIGNDVRNNWYELENIDYGGFRKPYFELNGQQLELKKFPFSAHSSMLTRLKVFFNRNARLYSFLRETRNRLRTRVAPNAPTGIRLDHYLYQTESTNQWSTAWAVTKKLILQLRDEVDQIGADFGVVIIPSKFQVHRQYWLDQLDQSEAMQQTEWDLDMPNDRLKTFLDINNIFFIDLLPGFRERSDFSATELYIRDDGHWNDDGHELAADIITDGLQKKLSMLVSRERGDAK